MSSNNSTSSAVKCEGIPLNCPVCDESHWQDMNAILSERHRFSLEVCTTCGFIAFRNLPNEAELIDYYRNEYRVEVKPENIASAEFKNANHKFFLKNEILEGKKSILDYGCAEGTFLKYCELLGHEVYGIELTTGFVEFARREYGLTVKEFLSDFGEQQFDLISLYHVLEHMQEPLQKLKEVRDRLAEGGKLYLAVPR